MSDTSVAWDRDELMRSERKLVMACSLGPSVLLEGRAEAVQPERKEWASAATSVPAHWLGSGDQSASLFV